MIGSNMVLIIIGIVFIVVGIALGIATIRSFYTRNMAEVYDALLGRNYVARIEKRKNKKLKKLNRAQASAEQTGNIGTGASVYPTGNTAAPVTAGTNSGNTVMLSPTQASASAMNSGNTTVLRNEQQFNSVSSGNAFSSGETTVLDPPVSNDSFKIVKEIFFLASNETI